MGPGEESAVLRWARFRTRGQTTKNVWFCLVAVYVKGTMCTSRSV